MGQNNISHHEDAEQRRRVAESLRDTLRILNSSQPLDEVLAHIVRQARDLLGARACTIHRIDYATQFVHIQTSVGLPQEMTDTPGFPLYSSGPDALIMNHRPAVVPELPNLSDISFGSDTDVQHRWRQALLTHFRAWLALPLVINEEVYGSLALFYGQPQTFSNELLDAASMFAEQAALAIDNARLHLAELERRQEAEQRRLVAESLRETLTLLNAGRPLQEILDHIVTQARDLLGAGACVLHRVDMQTGIARRQASAGWPTELLVQTSAPIASFGEGYNRMLEAGEPTYGNYGPLPDRVEEIRQNPDLPPEVKQRRIVIREKFAGILGLPLLLKNVVYGCLLFYYEEPQAFTPEQIDLASMFVEQAGMAIENARLYKQVQEAAAIAERNRLARDLHDSVTQTLFSASLIAQVLPRIWERDSEEGRKRLGELHQLTRGALAEMRTLLLELRPAAIYDTQLEQLLRHLVEAAIGRLGVPVNLVIDGACPTVLGEEKMAIYRVAQEALSNIGKHANARNVAVQLQCTEQALRLVVQDDGVGFDPQSVSGSHMGLAFMRERAHAIGAELEVTSQPAQGTAIALSYTFDQQEGRGT